MKLESLLWLFAAVFIIHEFEEIVMFRPWMKRNAHELHLRFPRFAKRLEQVHGPLSTSALSIAVLEQFVLLCAVIALSVELAWLWLWIAALTVYLAHIAVHAVQFLIYRKYCPFIITSIISLAYGAYAFAYLNTRHLLPQGPEIAYVLPVAALAAVNLRLAHALARKFQRWLLSWSGISNIE